MAIAERESDADYFRRRADMERDAAAAAASRRIESLHRQLAALYEDRARTGEAHVR